MAQIRKPVEQMTPEERETAFQEWMRRDSNRKLLSKAKRMAATALRNKYKGEYDRLVEQNQKTIQEQLASGKMTQADLDGKDGDDDSDESPAQTPARRGQSRNR